MYSLMFPLLSLEAGAKGVSLLYEGFEWYSNTGGNSGITGYRVDTDEDGNFTAIHVQFSTGWVYTYTVDSVGEEKLPILIDYAVSGKGLNGYIMRNVAKQYESRNDGSSF